MDRQSEAYRNMTDEDIVEEFPDCIHHPPIVSLRGIKLPPDYPDQDGEPKGLILAEVKLHDRILNPEAPDDHQVQGIYVRMAHRHGQGNET